MKKFISLAMAAALGLSALPAFGAEVTTEVILDDAMTGTPEQAIAVAKTTFNIPDELSEFSYDVETYGGKQSYYLSWYSPDYEKSVDVTVDSHLVPVRYSSYGDEWQNGLSYIRKNEMIKSAEDFLRTTIPQFADRLVYSEQGSGINRFRFDRYENGVRVEDNYAIVSVNKFTGQVNRYNLNWDYDGEFEVIKDGLSPEEAYAVLADKAVRVEYRIVGDKAIPVYIRDGSIYATVYDGSTFVSGGEYGIGDITNASAKLLEDEAADADAGGALYRSYSLTQEEIAAVQQMNSLIGEEKIKEIIASMPELEIPESYEMSLNYTTYRSNDKTEYRVRISMDNTTDDGYAVMQLNAETGELLDFYSYKYHDWRTISEDERIPQRQLDASGEAFISRIKDLTDYRLEDSIYGVTYIRYVGEIPYPMDHKSVSLSSVTGKITHYNEYNPNVEIVIPASLHDKLAAVKNAFSVERVYAYRMEVSEGEQSGPVLSWKLNPDFSFYGLRAEDGLPISYNGEEAKPELEKTNETDHYAWNVFEILRENGIYLPGSYSFDDQITGGEFRNLLNMLSNIDVVPYRYYYINDTDEQDDHPIDREMTARLIAKQMSWENIIDLDIYKNTFTDAESFEAGIGAAAILQAKNVMSADADGNFRPGEKLTYGEAYVIAYNLVYMDKKG